MERWDLRVSISWGRRNILDEPWRTCSNRIIPFRKSLSKRTKKYPGEILSCPFFLHFEEAMMLIPLFLRRGCDPREAYP
jgi:hypothetical protein